MCVCLCTCECKCVCMQIQLKLFLSNLVYFFLSFVQLLWQWFFKNCTKWKQLDWASISCDLSEKIFWHFIIDYNAESDFIYTFMVWSYICNTQLVFQCLFHNLTVNLFRTHKYLSLKALNSRYFLFQNVWHSGVKKVSGDLSSQPLIRLWSSYHLTLWSILNVQLNFRLTGLLKLLNRDPPSSDCWSTTPFLPHIWVYHHRKAKNLKKGAVSLRQSSIFL